VIDNVADGVRATGARIPADRVHARSLRRAVVVPGALDLENRLGGTASTTAAADVTAGTHADHGAHRMRWQDPAFGWFRARLYDRAWVLTLIAQTSERVGTVAVLPTLGSDLWSTVDVGVSGEARWTAAYRQMIQNAAFRARRARIIVHAWVDALHVDARMITWTIAIAVAANHATTVQRIAIITLAAATISDMVVRETLGIGAAWIRDQAWVHAVVVLAGLVARALTVVPALDRLARDLRIALIALFARAYRLVVSHVADCVGAAATGIAALPVDAGLVIAAVIICRASSDHRQLYCGIKVI